MKNIGFEINESMSACELLEDANGLTIILKCMKTNNKVKFFFPSVFSYRVTNESFRLKTLDGFGKTWPNLVSIIDDSIFLKWFHEESHNVYIDDGLKHFLIFTGEEFIDIINHKPPSVEFIT